MSFRSHYPRREDPYYGSGSLGGSGSGAGAEAAAVMVAAAAAATMADDKEHTDDDANDGGAALEGFIEEDELAMKEAYRVEHQREVEAEVERALHADLGLSDLSTLRSPTMQPEMEPYNGLTPLQLAGMYSEQSELLDGGATASASAAVMAYMPFSAIDGMGFLGHGRDMSPTVTAATDTQPRVVTYHDAGMKSAFAPADVAASSPATPPLGGEPDLFAKGTSGATSNAGQWAGSTPQP